VDANKLRESLRPGIMALSSYTHPMLPGICERLEIPFPAQAVSKKDRMREAFDALPDSGLQRAAELFLENHQPGARYRNELQEIMWAGLPVPDIDKKTRREIARALRDEELFLDGDRFDELLDRLWVLDDGNSGLFEAVFLKQEVPDRSLRKKIEKHVHMNPEDWTVETLFAELGALDCSHKRFGLFLEGLASADVRPDELSQRHFAEVVNGVLRACAAELRETEFRDGYPCFSLVHIHGSNKGKPKNLIFASQVKPDLRFRDAIDNDVEIVTNADKVLIYDRPIGKRGLIWSDVQTWWAETNGITSDKRAKVTLYRRLEASLPSDSPPQRLLFTSYHEHFGPAIPLLPALLPEVWLYWDPKTVRERGRDALLRFRMDFLLLLPGSARVVVEVDGKQHYADDQGRAAPAIYAAMAAADRELRLAGYDVFRFGAVELQGESGKVAANSFFDALFKRYGIVIPTAIRS
jgi:hypothetical protein